MCIPAGGTKMEQAAGTTATVEMDATEGTDAADATNVTENPSPHSKDVTKAEPRNAAAEETTEARGGRQHLHRGYLLARLTPSGQCRCRHPLHGDAVQ